MRSFNNVLAIAMAAAAISGAASAQWVECAPNTGNCNINANITTSVTLYKSNVYNLVGQIYVAGGATLTIEPGTVIASTANAGGSLAVTRGSKIIAIGTKEEPIIFTSTNDVATWVGGDPKTGTWRAVANEWGNLTVMGNAYVSENALPANTPTPNALNRANMEGLTTGPAFDQYGGGNDDDDSGSLKYVSIRYTGKVVGLGNELNGISLGGLGRETDISYIDLMNNVDDGFEIWGGTANFKYINVWNMGDDSIDIDQGWRGKAQFLNIVQGYSTVAGSGSGVGDNIFETDGAEQCDYQPVTTGVIYNVTAIGQPNGSASADHGTAWRDNARIQYRNAIFMDLGERLVAFDNIDGDGGLGYGCNGTLSWANTWTTDYNAVPAYPFSDPVAPIPGFYSAQTSGKLNEIKDSVFFNNNNAAAYTEAIARGVVTSSAPGVSVVNDNKVASLSPITSITRGPLVSIAGLNMTPVIGLDARPANDAVTSVGAAPNDGFFTVAQYRGAFAPNEIPWTVGWTAAYAFGYVKVPAPVAYCTAGTTTNGCIPSISGTGTPSASAGSGFSLNVANVEGAKQGLFFYSVSGRTVALWNGNSFLCIKAPTQRFGNQVSGGTANLCNGSFTADWNLYISNAPLAQGQPFIGCETVQAQAWFRDPPAGKSTNLSNALEFYVAP
ncbi:MAG: hypothetical protein JNN27_12880 [Planctomycetes bacterium]|nr:hypothetical protein [Planctomycetota bacterium]